MADEAKVRNYLELNCTTLEHRSHPTDFTVDVSGEKGPTPGAITALTTGTQVDLSELTTPGLCRIYNLDDTNFVTVGIFDVGTNEFYPLMEVGPGEFYVLKLSRFIESSLETGTGSGTTDSGNKLMIKADDASVNVDVSAFEA